MAASPAGTLSGDHTPEAPMVRDLMAVATLAADAALAYQDHYTAKGLEEQGQDGLAMALAVVATCEQLLLEVGQALSVEMAWRVRTGWPTRALGQQQLPGTGGKR